MSDVVIASLSVRAAGLSECKTQILHVRSWFSLTIVTVIQKRH